MGEIHDEGFKDITCYVPKFNLKPVVTNTLDRHSTPEDISRSDIYIDDISEIPKYVYWYIKPQIDVQQGLSLKKEEEGINHKIYDNLVDKLITDHGWRLEDFDILKDKAKTIINTDNRYKDGIEITERPFYNSKTTRRIISPDYQTERRTSQFRTGIAIEDSFQESVHKYLGKCDKILDVSDTKCNKCKNSIHRDVTDFDTLYIGKRNRKVLKYIPPSSEFVQQSVANYYSKEFANKDTNSPKGGLEDKCRFKKSWEDFQRNALDMINRWTYESCNDEEKHSGKQSVKSAVEVPVQSALEESEMGKEDLKKYSVVHSVSKSFEAVLRTRILSNEITHKLSGSTKTKNADRQEEEEYIPSCIENQHNFDTRAPNETKSNVYHGTNGKLKSKYTQMLRPKITNSLYARRRKLRAHLWRNAPKNDLRIDQTRPYILEDKGSISSKSDGKNCGDILNTNRVDSQPDQSLHAARERLYHIIKMYKQYKEKVIDTVVCQLLNSSNIDSLVSDIVPNSFINKGVDSLKQNSINNGINSTWKTLQLYLNTKNLKDLEILAKLISHKVTNIAEKESSNKPPLLLESSVLPMKISDKSSISSDNERTICTNKDQSSLDIHSNTVLYSKNLDSKTLPSEFKIMELDEWALKYQLWPNLIQRNETNLTPKLYGTPHINTISKHVQVSREKVKYSNNIRQKTKVQPGKSDSYLYKKTFENAYSIQGNMFRNEKTFSPAMKAESSDRRLKTDKYQHRHSHTNQSLQDHIKYPNKNHDMNVNKTVVDAKMNKRTPKIRIKNANFSKFYKPLPTVDRLVESLWHDHKTKKTVRQ